MRTIQRIRSNRTDPTGPIQQDRSNRTDPKIPAQRDRPNRHRIRDRAPAALQSQRDCVAQPRVGPRNEGLPGGSPSPIFKNPARGSVPHKMPVEVEMKWSLSINNHDDDRPIEIEPKPNDPIDSDPQRRWVTSLNPPERTQPFQGWPLGGRDTPG